MIFTITFDRDDSFISDFSERSKRFSFVIYFRKKKVNILSFLINFFIVNNRFFNIFITFLKSLKTIESWITFVAILTIFFSKAEKFKYIFFLKCANFLLMRINSRKKEAIKNDESSLWKERKEKTMKRERICRLLLKSTSEKSKRFRESNITEFENSIAATKLWKPKKKVSKIKETILIIFFIDLIVFFFDSIIFLIATIATSEFEQFVTLRSNTEQSAHRLFSKAEKLNMHSILFFRQNKQRVSSFWLLKLYVFRVVLKWIALCALDCRYSNQI